MNYCGWLNGFKLSGIEEEEEVKEDVVIVLGRYRKGMFIMGIGREGEEAEVVENW